MKSRREGWRAHRIHPLLAPPKYAAWCEVVRPAGLTLCCRFSSAVAEAYKDGRKFYSRGLIHVLVYGI
jgi:hypothetical protein